MKLIKRDKEILKDMGVSEADFPQMEVASTGRNTVYELDGQTISRDEAIRLVGRRAFLAGLNRSAFHWNCSQTLPDGRKLSFDSGRFFRT